MASKLLQRLSPGGPVGTPASAVETVIMTSLVYTYDNPNPFVGLEHAGGGQGVRISGQISITPGASTTAGVVRVRQGGLAGTQVGNTITVPLTAAVPNSIPYDQIDNTRYPAGGGVYVVTLSTTAATGVGSVTECTMTCDGA
jgi:hypothetical protein